MAERLADVIAQIDNVRQLQAIVGAMRGIAASPGIAMGTAVVVEEGDLMQLFGVKLKPGER